MLFGMHRKVAIRITEVSRHHLEVIDASVRSVLVQLPCLIAGFDWHAVPRLPEIPEAVDDIHHPRQDDALRDLAPGVAP